MKNAKEIRRQSIARREGRPPEWCCAKHLIDFDNAQMIEGMTQAEFDKAMKYHSRYVDEMHRHRHELVFNAAQLRRIAAVRECATA